MMLGKFDIVEIPSLPRTRDELNSMISIARHQIRKRNLTRFAALNLVAWAIIIPVFWSTPPPSAAHTVHATTQRLYIPSVQR